MKPGMIIFIGRHKTKRLLVLIMALSLVVTNITVYQPQTVEAASKNRITLETKYKTLYVGESYTLKAYSFFIAFFVVVLYNKTRVKYTITILIIKEVSN